MIASYAIISQLSKGRLTVEETPFPFQTDRERIIYSTAFRRLEYKTQVFTNEQGDHYRTRLTHSLEVAHLARQMSKSLHLCEDLAETLALAHDIGHPPFGHAGEEALNRKMLSYGGFDHNAHTLKILTSLEQNFIDFKGLNLTWETLEGMVKHNGPLIGPYSSRSHALPVYIKTFDANFSLHLHQFASLEAQIASFADDITYICHDVEDGFRAGFFDIETLTELPLIGSYISALQKKRGGVSPHLYVYEANRFLKDYLKADVLEETKRRLRTHNIETLNDVYNASCALVGFSKQCGEQQALLKSFLMQHMYRHPHVMRITGRAQRVIESLFDFYLENPLCLPLSWQRHAMDTSVEARASLVCDYIAGMTDRFAMRDYEALFHAPLE